MSEATIHALLFFVFQPTDEILKISVFISEMGFIGKNSGLLTSRMNVKNEFAVVGWEVFRYVDWLQIHWKQYSPLPEQNNRIEGAHGT